MEKIIIGAVVGGLAVYGFFYLLRNNNNKNELENIETKKYDILKFSDVVLMAKELTKETGIPENQNLVLLKVNKDYIITFYNNTKSEIVEGKMLQLQCNTIDESLRLAFGNKDMIIIEE